MTLPELVDDDAKTESWRLEQLLKAGYPIPLAEKLAARRGVDLHEAEALVERGCTPEVAAEILL